jgi:XTP/dITP diphosphohydrolase
MSKRILVATHNPGKITEYADLLSDLHVEWLSLDEVGITADVEETGTTFEENARLKAVFYARESSLLTLADDSGLEVDALGGEPGIYSARYGGPGLDDAGRYRLLLEKLRASGSADRSARFRCVIALCTPEGEIFTTEGVVEGVIAERPGGKNGFGYDPVFYIPTLGMTSAGLDPATKNRISHRGRAVEAIRPTLEKVLGSY